MARSGNKRHVKNTPGPLSDEEEKEAITKCICEKTHTNGLMIQCEKCKVWQHCACVNIPDFDSCPSEYYCKDCKTFSPDINKSKKPSRDSSKTNGEKKGSSKQNDKISSPLPSSKKTTERSNKNKNLPRVKSNNELMPIKIKLNVPEKEEDCSSGGSGGAAKNSRSSPVEFTTKRGRKTTKVAYRTYSEEDPELGIDPSTLASSPTSIPSPKSKKTKIIIDVPADPPSKKKRKENKTKRTDSANVSTNSITVNSTNSPEFSSAPMKIYLTTKIPIPPHQILNSSDTSYDDAPPPSPTILPSNIPLSSLLTRAPSPPPRPKATSSKMPINDIRKRVNAIERYVEQHQAQLKEHLKSNPQTYKSQKHHYSASSKQAKELLHTINEFNVKLDSLQ